MWLRGRSTVPSLSVLVGIGRLTAQSRRHPRRFLVRRSGPRVDRRAQVPPPALGRRRARRADGSPAAVGRCRCRHLGADQCPSCAPTWLRPGGGDRPGRRAAAGRAVPPDVVPNPWRTTDRQVTRRPARRPGVSRPTPAPRPRRTCRRRRGHHGCNASHGGRCAAVGWGGAGRARRRGQHPAGPCSPSSKVGVGELNHRRCQGHCRPPTRR